MTLGDRAAKEIEAGFDHEVKALFAVLVVGLAGGEKYDSAVSHFAHGLTIAAEARDEALAAIGKVFQERGE